MLKNNHGTKENYFSSVATEGQYTIDHMSSYPSPHKRENIPYCLVGVYCTLESD